jgi:hypothetical protein
MLSSFSRGEKIGQIGIKKACYFERRMLLLIIGTNTKKRPTKSRQSGEASPFQVRGFT